MDSRYEISVECSGLIKLAKIPTLDKLMLDLQLVQIRRYVLRDANLNGLELPECNEGAFKELKAELAELSETFHQAVFDRVSQRLEEITDALWTVDRACTTWPDTANARYPSRCRSR